MGVQIWQRRGHCLTAGSVAVKFGHDGMWLLILFPHFQTIITENLYTSDFIDMCQKLQRLVYL